MRNYPRPAERHLAVERLPVLGAICPSCGGDDVRAYPVLSEGGWWNVHKCQDCLTSIRRERGSFFGGLELQTAKIPGLEAAQLFGSRR